jgi:hypothetical protein
MAPHLAQKSASKEQTMPARGATNAGMIAGSYFIISVRDLSSSSF